MYDVFFLSHDEPMASHHWEILKRNVPSARHVHGIDGIVAAHKTCAVKARTEFFFVIDADNEVVDYDFSFRVPDSDREFVHLWYARNPLNSLVYGWGAVKLFPRRVLRESGEDLLDMTTSFSLKIITEVKSITHFNYNPFVTWRSAFREAVKLSLCKDSEAQDRLSVWCSHAVGIHAAECLAGANAGKAFGTANRDDPETLRNINDYTWLRQQFEQRT
jgi:hypothetical protein